LQIGSWLGASPNQITNRADPDRQWMSCTATRWRPKKSASARSQPLPADHVLIAAFAAVALVRSVSSRKAYGHGPPLWKSW